MNEPQPFPRYIAIEGPIGVGKTTLTRRLATALGAQILLEGADDNPFLPQYYQEPARYALATQLHFLCQRTRQLQPYVQTELFAAGVVADFMFEKDRLFAELALNADEFALYEDIYRRFAPQVPIPDLVIYLSAPVALLKQRIAHRGIGYEQTITENYLARLVAAYDAFFHNFHATSVLMVDTTQVDLVQDSRAFAALVAQLAQRFQGTRTVHASATGTPAVGERYSLV